MELNQTRSSVLNRITVRPITYKLIIFRALISEKTLSFMFITEEIESFCWEYTRV